VRLRRAFALGGVALVSAVLAGCGDSPSGTGAAPGKLAVEVSGLPPNVFAVVTVDGPARTVTVLNGSGTVDALMPGTYTVAAADVSAGGVRYSATPASETVDVPAGGTGIAGTINYAATTGRLSVLMEGVPNATGGDIVVSGPGGFSKSTDRATTFDLLAPGSYTVTAHDVVIAGTTYRPDAATQTVVVGASGTPAEVTVRYGGGTGTLELMVNGLPAGMKGTIVVTTPDGQPHNLTGSTTLMHVPAGDVTVNPIAVGADLVTYTPTAVVQTVSVTDGGTASATVTYVGAPLKLGLVQAVSGLTDATFLTAPEGDGRRFIVERAGRVRLIIAGPVEQQPFLDISARVNSTGERGLLSIAFDPAYWENGYFYAYYVGKDGSMVVERFASTPGSNVATGSAGIVLTFPHGGENHHGGLITFGPDGMLYVASGDGGCCGDPNNNAQNLTNFLGKMLRLNVRDFPYTIPAQNPYITTAGVRPEIWAYGLRNPWRYTFDPPTSSLYVGDVGQDAHEEVDVVPSTHGGYYFGWRVMEGFCCYNPSSGCNPNGALTLPVLDYPHSDGCSVSAGYVYRGFEIPELTGHFLYADYCKGWLRSFRATGGGVAAQMTWSITKPGTLSFGRDGRGELYMVTATTIYKIVRQ
jgi:glucose/arabinose dehydrogenase